MLRSRIVAWLRVLLPLAALALLSVLFLLGRKPEPDAAIPYADVSPQDLAERQAITNPTYTGVTGDGTQLTISGTEASPGPDKGDGTLSNVRMTLRAADGRAADVTAGSGAFRDGVATLTEGVRMTTADGWVVTAPEFRAVTGEGIVSADRQVDVRAPFGDLTAGAMELRPKAPGEQDHVLDLKGGVRLIYRP